MRCEDLHVELSAWIDGELNAAGRAGVAEHLQSCPSCSEYVHALRDGSSLVRALGTPRAPTSITEAAARQVASMSRPAAASLTWRFSFAWPAPLLGIGLAGLAAALALAIFAGRQPWSSDLSGNTASFHSAASGVDSPARKGAGYRLSSAPDDVTGAIAITRGYDFRAARDRRDIATFNARERFAWDQGVWRHERRFGRDGWWWDVEGAWYWYDKPSRGPPAVVSNIRFAADSGPDGSMPAPRRKTSSRNRADPGNRRRMGTFAAEYGLKEGKAWAR